MTVFFFLFILRAGDCYQCALRLKHVGSSSLFMPKNAAETKRPTGATACAAGKSGTECPPTIPLSGGHCRRTKAGGSARRGAPGRPRRLPPPAFLRRVKKGPRRLARSPHEQTATLFANAEATAHTCLCFFIFRQQKSSRISPTALIFRFVQACAYSLCPPLRLVQ